jgi:nicotinamidase
MMERKIITIGPKDALTIIDPQNDFVNQDGALYVAGVPGEPDNKAIIERIVALVQKPFGWLAFSKDEHPAENHIEFGLFGPHCVQRSDGAEIVDEIWQAIRSKWGGREIPGADRDLLIKGEDPALISYSIAFSPQFGEHIANLRQLGIERILVVGWAYTHCVGASASAYAGQGFETYVIRDCTRSVPPPYGDAKKMGQKLALYGVKLINFEEIG